MILEQGSNMVRSLFRKFGFGGRGLGNYVEDRLKGEEAGHQDTNQEALFQARYGEGLGQDGGQVRREKEMDSRDVKEMQLTGHNGKGIGKSLRWGSKSWESD